MGFIEILLREILKNTLQKINGLVQIGGEILALSRSEHEIQILNDLDYKRNDPSSFWKIWMNSA